MFRAGKHPLCQTPLPSLGHPGLDGQSSEPTSWEPRGDLGVSEQTSLLRRTWSPLQLGTDLGNGPMSLVGSRGMGTGVGEGQIQNVP